MNITNNKYSNNNKLYYKIIKINTIRITKLIFFISLILNCFDNLMSQTIPENFINKGYKDFNIIFNYKANNSSEIYQFDSLQNKFTQDFVFNDSIIFRNAYYNFNFDSQEFTLGGSYKINDNFNVFAYLPIQVLSLNKINKFDSVNSQNVTNTINFNRDSTFNLTLLNHLIFGTRYYLKNKQENYIQVFSEFRIALNKVSIVNNNPEYPFWSPLSNEILFGSAIGYKINKLLFESSFLYNYRDRDYLDRLIGDLKITFQNIEEASIYAHYNFQSSLNLKKLQNNKIHLNPNQISLGYNHSTIGFGFNFYVSKKYLIDMNYNIMLSGVNTFKTNNINLNLFYLVK